MERHRQHHRVSHYRHNPALQRSRGRFPTLPVLTLADSEVRLGLADLRGDGRPDYLYQGRVLYAATVQPAILPAAGGPIAITGMGFHANSVVTVNGVKAAVTSITPTEITAIAPPAAGATGNVLLQVQDPLTLGIAVISDGLSYGAQNSDTITTVSAPTGTVVTGVPHSFTVAVSSSKSPAAGATVTYTVTQGAATLACGQPSCAVVTSANGIASLAVAANSSATTTVTATLANGAAVSTQFTAAAGAAPAITAITPNLYLAAGATAQWTPQGLVLNNGTPAANAAVTWTPVTGGVTAPTTASLSGANGIVTQQLAAGPLNTGIVVPVNACLSTNACAQFNVISVSPATAQLTPIAGITQDIPTAQAFTPVTLEVTDPSGDPMAGAVVTFYETLERLDASLLRSIHVPHGPITPAADRSGHLRLRRNRHSEPHRQPRPAHPPLHHRRHRKLRPPRLPAATASITAL